MTGERNVIKVEKASLYENKNQKFTEKKPQPKKRKNKIKIYKVRDNAIIRWIMSSKSCTFLYFVVELFRIFNTSL